MYIKNYFLILFVSDATWLLVMMMYHVNLYKQATRSILCLKVAVGQLQGMCVEKTESSTIGDLDGVFYLKLLLYRVLPVG